MEMKDVLEGLGMVDMFHDGKADFSGISSNNELFVANVYHRGIRGDWYASNELNIYCISRFPCVSGFVEVNEEGTEAAAVTSKRSLKMSGRSFHPKKQEPFVVSCLISFS